MGACMAPAAASAIRQHMEDFQTVPEDYDKIITGDLGKVGKQILITMLREQGIDISANHMDCGIEIYDADTQDTQSGGRWSAGRTAMARRSHSPGIPFLGGDRYGSSALTLSAYILKQLEEHNWRKVLFLPTGALLSKTSFNEGKSVPGIAHALVLESL